MISTIYQKHDSVHRWQVVLPNSSSCRKRKMWSQLIADFAFQYQSRNCSQLVVWKLNIRTDLTLYVSSQIECSKCHPADGQLFRSFEKNKMWLFFMRVMFQSQYWTLTTPFQLNYIFKRLNRTVEWHVHVQARSVCRLTWMQCGNMLAKSVVLQHVQ